MKLESERVHIRSSRFLQLQLPKALKAEIEKLREQVQNIE